VTAPSPPLRALLFDFTGTLYDADSDLEAHRQVAVWLIGRYELDVTPDSLHQTANRLIATYLKTLERGKYVSGTELMKALWRRLSTVFRVPSTPAALQEFIDVTRDLHRQYARPVPGALETLRTLKSDGFRLALVSQIDRDLLDVIVDELAMRDLFDVIASAEDVLEARPSPAVLVSALERLAVEPAAAAMVGDDVVCDVEPARKLGIRTVLLAPRGTVGAAKADQRVDRIADVVAWAREHAGEPRDGSEEPSRGTAGPRDRSADPSEPR